MLQRVQRDALAACLIMAAVAALLSRSVWYAAAVLGGGALIGVSFWSIARGVDAMAARRRAGLYVAGRYALLAFLAYVMIARLRLPPLGLIAGASSFVVAALREALRTR